MPFTSLAYLLFLTFVSIVFYWIPRRFRWQWLIIVSYGYYSTFSILFLPFLLLSTLINFFIGNKIKSTQKQKSKKIILYFGIFLNVGSLVILKYILPLDTALFYNAINLWEWNTMDHQFLIPLGVSFYTFHNLSYIIDIYRGYLEPEPILGKYALYIGFFPKLIAGPIQQAKSLIPQFEFNDKFDLKKGIQGIQLIIWGLFKKLVVADHLAIYVNQVYGSLNSYEGVTIIIASFFFVLQIFYDFSAYSDIAIGSARILGIQLSKNFGHHIYYTSPTHFWKEWHITLTNWFRNYVYFSLTDLLRKKWFWYFGLLVTFSLTGLWHGQKWGFLIWGALHGSYLLIDNLTVKYRKAKFEQFGINQYPRILSFISVLALLPLWIFAALFFRADSIEHAFLLIKKASTLTVDSITAGMGLDSFLALLILIMITDIFNFKLKKLELWEFLDQRPAFIQLGFCSLLVSGIYFLGVNSPSPFYYFRF